MLRRKFIPRVLHCVSRRNFLRGMALATVTVTLPNTGCTRLEKTTNAPTHTPTEQASQLSALGQAQVQAIFGKYGNRLSEEQKADVKRLVGQYQGISEALRSFQLDNSIEPAMIFRIYRSEKQ